MPKVQYLANYDKPQPRKAAFSVGSVRFVPNQVTEISPEDWSKIKEDPAIAQRLEWGSLKIVAEDAVTDIDPNTLTESTEQTNKTPLGTEPNNPPPPEGDPPPTQITTSAKRATK